MKKKDEMFIIIFSFVFPLTIIAWAVRESMGKAYKVVEVEGLLFNLNFLLAFFLLKYLSFIPILGVVFGFLFHACLWLYLISVIAIIVVKSGNIFREIPFITLYAEKLTGN